MNDVPSSAELDALRLSLEVAMRSVGFSLPLAVLVAWILTRARFPGRRLFDALVHLRLVLPPVAVGYVLLILFGARVLHPFLWQPLAPEEIPTGHLTDGARIAAEAAGHVRWFGTDHSALGQWKKTGNYDLFDDPFATRW